MRLLLDANLATLLVVGSADSDYIRNHKRLGKYSGRDFDALARFVATFAIVVFLPNVLTEVSNLAVQGVHEPLRRRIMEKLKQLIDNSAEIYMASGIAGSRPEFVRLGLTDSALLACCAPDTVLLTHDGELFSAAGDIGVHAETFERLRSPR